MASEQPVNMVSVLDTKDMNQKQRWQTPNVKTIQMGQWRENVLKPHQSVVPKITNIFSFCIPQDTFRGPFFSGLELFGCTKTTAIAHQAQVLNTV